MRSAKFNVPYKLKGLFHPMLVYLAMALIHCVGVTTLVFFVCLRICVCETTNEQKLDVLSKQVSTLLDRRREDIAIIEENLRKKLARTQELADVKEEMKILR